MTLTEAEASDLPLLFGLLEVRQRDVRARARASQRAMRGGKKGPMGVVDPAALPWADFGR